MGTPRARHSTYHARFLLTMETSPNPPILVKNGYILSMDSNIGDIPNGDLLIGPDGRIVSVGPAATAPTDSLSELPPNTKVIDATNMIVLPGFVEVHWHMWNSIWRGLTHDAPGYMSLQKLAAFYTAEDHYNAVRYAALEALNAGITTCHDWANAIKSEEDALAHCKALVDSGIRARFGYGKIFSPTLAPAQQQQPVPATRSDLIPIQEWLEQNAMGRVDLGMICHNPQTLPAEVALSRSLGLKTIGQHVDLSQHLDLLGPDFIFTHGPGTPPQFVSLLASRGVKIGLCPSTDPLIGAGLPPLPLFLSNGIPFENIGFSVDVTCQTAVDPFSAMRTIQNASRIHHHTGKSFEQIIFAPPSKQDPTNGLTMPRTMLQLATLNGARILGLEREIGSLVPGKQADLILVNLSNQPNLFPSTKTANPTYQLVQCGLPSNVDTVIVNGRVVKREGKMVIGDPAEIGKRAVEAMRGVSERSGLASVDLGL